MRTSAARLTEVGTAQPASDAGHLSYRRADAGSDSRHQNCLVAGDDLAASGQPAIDLAAIGTAGIDATSVGVAGVRRPVGYTPRRGAGLTSYERVLARAGLGPVAGIDEAGRGACAGPLVVAAVALDRWSGDAGAVLADSKLLTARARETSYQQIVRTALAWHVVVIGAGEIDRYGLHVCNVAGMRRALAGLAATPGYVLTDGFEVPGLAVPALAMWKGDQVAACVAAASIVAKVTRDRIMKALHGQYPAYGFARHKGYSTAGHMAALAACGPSPVHRRSFVNVSRLGCELPPADGPEPDWKRRAGDDLRSPEGAADRELGLGPALIGGMALDVCSDGPIVEFIAGSSAGATGWGTGAASHMPGGSSEGKS